MMFVLIGLKLDRLELVLILNDHVLQNVMNFKILISNV